MKETNLTDIEALQRSKLKRPYQAPELVKWGSILDLTQGPALGVDDVDFGASQGGA